MGPGGDYELVTFVCSVSELSQAAALCCPLEGFVLRPETLVMEDRQKGDCEREREGEPQPMARSGGRLGDEHSLQTDLPRSLSLESPVAYSGHLPGLETANWSVRTSVRP